MIKSLMNKQAEEPLAEFEDFLCVKGCTPEKQALSLRTDELTTGHSTLVDAAAANLKTDKRLKSESVRTSAAARAGLEDGLFVSASGRNGVINLHFLGDCFIVPGLDCFRFQFMGKLMPPTTQFDGVCKTVCKEGIGPSPRNQWH